MLGSFRGKILEVYQVQMETEMGLVGMGVEAEVERRKDRVRLRVRWRMLSPLVPLHLLRLLIRKQEEVASEITLEITLLDPQVLMEEGAQIFERGY